jgi:hypothetical protein
LDEINSEIVQRLKARISLVIANLH